MNNFTGCLICGDELEYLTDPIQNECRICRNTFVTKTICKSGHFVCDQCHENEPNDFIINYCIKECSNSDPLSMQNDLLNIKVINMHGPEHHFLVPSVLITAYYNKIQDQSQKEKKLKMLKRQVANITGGFCGFYGACGTAIGAGTFLSFITDCNPMETESWGNANILTGKILQKIGELGGPRCCKRTSFVSVIESSEFVKERYNMDFNVNADFKCSFKKYNKECIGKKCPFF